MDNITLDKIKIADYLAEDKENHIVLRDYDNPKSTFLVNLNDLRKSIQVDCGKVDIERGEIDEDTTDDYDPGNSNFVPGPGAKGGRSVVYKCNKKMEGVVTLNSVNNLEPYVDIKGIAGWGGVIPLLEVYDKLLNPTYTDRGQYFSYKYLGKKIDPFASISTVMYPDTKGENRYGGILNYVSASHCQEGQDSDVMAILPAVADTSSQKGGKKKSNNSTKSKKSNNSKKSNKSNNSTKSKKSNKSKKLKKTKKNTKTVKKNYKRPGRKPRTLKK